MCLSGASENALVLLKYVPALRALPSRQHVPRASKVHVCWCPRCNISYLAHGTLSNFLPCQHWDPMATTQRNNTVASPIVSHLPDGKIIQQYHRQRKRCAWNIQFTGRTRTGATTHPCDLQLTTTLCARLHDCERYATGSGGHA